MMYAIVVLRFWCIFFLVWQTWTVSSPDCSARLWKFAKAVSNFTFCAVSNSRPFRFCCHCKDVYGESLNGHKAIVEKKECHDDLIMAEKYQLVEYSYAFVVNLWESANCPDCFVKGERVPTEISSKTKKFFHKLDQVDHCFYNNSQIHINPSPVNHSRANTSKLRHNTLCDNCKTVYHALEESFKDIIKSDSQEYKVCADVSASMNYTRQLWSKTFHCVTIYTDLVSVVALTVFFCFLPIIFYTSVKLHGDSQNRKTGASLRPVGRS